jgi:hypothetical protein
VEISRKTLFESGTLQIGLVESRPRSDACGDVERQDRNAMVLPLSGVFSKHDAPGRHIIATPCSLPPTRPIASAFPAASAIAR